MIGRDARLRTRASARRYNEPVVTNEGAAKLRSGGAGANARVAVPRTTVESFVGRDAHEQSLEY